MSHLKEYSLFQAPRSLSPRNWDHENKTGGNWGGVESCIESCERHDMIMT